MFMNFCRRSALPLRVVFSSLVFGLGISSSAVANDHVTLHPSRTQCQVVTVPFSASAKRCDVLYDGAVVHEGREVNTAAANGDCAKCRYVLEQAVMERKDVIMLRGYDELDAISWHNDEFFTVAR